MNLRKIACKNFGLKIGALPTLDTLKRDHLAYLAYIYNDRLKFAG